MKNCVSQMKNSLNEILLYETILKFLDEIIETDASNWKIVAGKETMRPIRLSWPMHCSNLTKISSTSIFRVHEGPRSTICNIRLRQTKYCHKQATL